MILVLTIFCFALASVTGLGFGVAVADDAAKAPVVHSGREGARPDRVVEPTLEWSVDTEQEDVLIGRIADVRVGPDGNVYLLDNQLSQIFVYSPQGEYLRTLGQEGEGPGEFRNPMGMFFLNDGTLGVLQLMPGKVAMLDLEGTPVGDLPVPRSGDDTPQMLMNGSSAGDHVVLQLTNNAMLGGATVRMQTSLVGVGRDGTVLGTYYDNVEEQKIHSSGGGIAISFDAASMGTWAAGEDGTVYHAPGRNDYTIKVLDASGQPLRVIQREYEPRPRTSDEMEALRETMSAFGGAAPEIDATDPDIAEMLPREGGELWVLTSRGQNDRPEGSVGVYDVFDAQGKFQGRLDLRTGFDAGDDVAFITGDRLFVIENGAGELSAGGGGMHVVMSRGDRSDEDDEGPEPMRILCYRLPS